MSETSQQVKKSIQSRVERARAFSEKVRKAYKEAYEKAVGAGKDKIEEIVSMGESIEPKIRSAIDNKIQSAQHVIDELNQTLADRSIPKVRRKKAEPKDDSSSHEASDSQ